MVQHTVDFGEQAVPVGNLEKAIPNAACRIISCDDFPCCGICLNQMRKERIEHELKDAGIIIFCTFAYCTKCGTVNGHGNDIETGCICRNRLSTPQINNI